MLPILALFALGLSAQNQGGGQTPCLTAQCFASPYRLPTPRTPCFTAQCFTSPYYARSPRAVPLVMKPKQPVIYRARQSFVKTGKLPGQCSIPLLEARKVAKPERMPTRRPADVDPKMKMAAPAPPCDNWFNK